MAVSYQRQPDGNYYSARYVVYSRTKEGTMYRVHVWEDNYGSVQSQCSPNCEAAQHGKDCWHARQSRDSYIDWLTRRATTPTPPPIRITPGTQDIVITIEGRKA